MYESRFGLRKNPFSMTPDAASLFLTPVHREALAGLAYGIMRRKGFILLVGDAGTGKTTLLRRLLGTLPATSVESSCVVHPTLTPSEFLEMVLLDFNLPNLPASKAQRLALLRKYLLDTHRRNKAAVLIVDEAHKLSSELLEEIRLLTNFETDNHKLLQIVLAGQTEMNDLFAREDLRQLKQRIAVRLEIRPLAGSELRPYLEFRWAAAGGAPPLPFDEAALGAIEFWSRGIPRLVNAICDNALVLALAAGASMASSAHVQDAVEDLGLKPEVARAAPAAPAATNGSHGAGGIPFIERYGQSRPSFFRRFAAFRR